VSVRDDVRAEAKSDAELVQATRAGDPRAYATLWSRHADAGRRAARACTRSIDPDDLVSEAFARILQAIRNGGGPTEAFRPYLLASIRNTAARWGSGPKDVQLDYLENLPDEDAEDRTEQLSDRSMLIAAFRTLPDSWRTVLWYSEVEGMKPREIAPLLGMSANSVAALSLRAREGFRQAWLQAHIADPHRPAECRWACQRMVGRKRPAVTSRDRSRFTAHLDGCRGCAIVAREIDEVSGRLRVVLLPLLLGGAGATAFVAADGGAPASASTIGSAPAPTAAPLGLAACGALLIAAVVLTAAAPRDLPASAMTSGLVAERPPTSVSPLPVPTVPAVPAVPTPPPAPPSAPVEPVDVQPAPAPTVPPAQPAALPPVTPPPAPPVVPPAAPAPIAEPLTLRILEDGSPVLRLAGTGTAGAAIALIDETGVVLATAVVGPDGDFVASVPGELLRSGMYVTAQQTLPDAVTATDPVGPISPPAPGITTDGSIIHLIAADADGDGAHDDAFATFTGLAGASVQVEIDGILTSHVVVLDDVAADDFLLDIPLGAHEITLRYLDPESGDTGLSVTYETVVSEGLP
jgi:RNA polymerase sigma factor (sigma-70 family)